jgi:hypothetical protein
MRERFRLREITVVADRGMGQSSPIFLFEFRASVCLIGT